MYMMLPVLLHMLQVHRLVYVQDFGDSGIFKV